MSEMNMSLLSAKDKQSLLAEAMGAVAAIGIIQAEINDARDFTNVDMNYVHALSPYLAETCENFNSFEDAKQQLSKLTVDLSKSLNIYINSLDKTVNEGFTGLV